MDPRTPTCETCRERPAVGDVADAACARCRPAFDALVANLVRGRSFFRLDRFGGAIGSHRLAFEERRVANVRGDGARREVRFEGDARFMPIARLRAESFDGTRWYVDGALARADAVAAIDERVAELLAQRDEIGPGAS